MQGYLRLFILWYLCLFWYLPQTKCQRIELQTEAGLLLPSIHEPSNELLKHSEYRACLIRYMWQADTNKVYSKIYNYHSFGISLYGATFSNSSIGDPFACSFFIRTPWVSKKKWGLFYEIGSGIACNFNPYNKNLNSHNELTGTRINMFGHLAIGLEYYFSQRFAMQLSIGYRHFSNGFIKWPNYGINILPFTVSGNYSFLKSKASSCSENNLVFLKYNRLVFFYAPGTKNFYAGERNYFTSTLCLQLFRHITYKSAFGCGFDIFYNSSGKYKVQNNESDLRRSLSCGIHVTYEWIFTENFSINTGFGIYLLRHAENDEHYPYYERICARYLIHKNLFAGIGIKINGNTSDYIEWTLGYVFKKDKNTYR